MNIRRKRSEPPLLTPIGAQRKRLRNANKVIGGCGCAGFVFGGIIVLMYTAGIMLKLGFPAMVICLGVVPLCFNLYAKTRKFKWLLHTARTAGIALLAGIVLAPVVCIHFERVPLLYPVKRLVFTQGVSSRPIGNVILPYWLPAQYTDYYFYTEPSLVAQDYTPVAYLFLHTDEATLRTYEEKLRGSAHLERKENCAYTPEKLEQNESLLYQNLPRFVYYKLTDIAGITDDLSHAIVYQSDNGYTWYVGSGTLINYETGLLVVWL